MALQRFLDSCAFTPTGGGSGTWTVSAAIQGYMTPAGGGAVDGGQYSYRAESADKSQWEVGHGTYTASGTTLSRTVLFSSNSNAAVNFSAAPNIYLTILAEDLPGLVLLNSTDISSATGSVTLSLPAGYKKFRLEVFGLDCGANGGIRFKASDDNGTSYYTGSTDYQFIQAGQAGGSYVGGSGTIEAVYGTDAAAGANYRTYWVSEIDPGDGSYYPMFLNTEAGYDGSGYMARIIGQWLTHATTVNKIQLYMTTGNIAKAKIRLWGSP